MIAKAGGPLDGIALGEWVHARDVRDALGAPGAYAGVGLPDALRLLALLTRERRHGAPGSGSGDGQGGGAAAAGRDRTSCGCRVRWPARRAGDALNRLLRNLDRAMGAFGVRTGRR